jgi:GT2 family glycosyltransferase
MMAAVNSEAATAEDVAADTLDVSIVVVSFNTRDLLRTCLASAMVECDGLAAEILVVDNHSTDGSVEMVEAEFPQVVLIRSEVNLGFGAANNVAMRRARGQYFVLLNSDAYFWPGALKLAIKHMDETPQCGLGGGLLLGRGGAWQPSAKTFHSVLGDLIVMTGLADKFPKSPIFGRASRTFANESKAARVDWVPGAFMIVRPVILERVGLFDPDFFLYYEEVDLCRRIKRAGMEIWYWPDVVITHLMGESSKKLSQLTFSSRAAQVVLWRMRSALLYYRKHHGWQVWLLKWMEIGLYRVTVARNRLSKLPERQERAKAYEVMIGLMEQAWKETQGGRISPPRPW